MNTYQFKVGDKVVRLNGGRAIYCVTAVRYLSRHSGEADGTESCYLELIGENNPSGERALCPSVLFRRVWSGEKAIH